MNTTSDDVGGASPVRFRHTLPDGEMGGLAWPAPDKPRLVFIHANGFCARAYQQLLSRLSASFDILAPDLRGHGTSHLPADPDRHHSWDIYAADIGSWLASLDRAPDAFAGHSMGAIISLLAASRLPRPVPLALVEPVILPPLLYLLSRGPWKGVMRGRVPIAKAARKRFNGWEARADAATRYARHPTFKNWASGVLDDYLEDGLVETDTGEIRLSCSPFWEAANYEAQGHDIGAALRRQAGPVSVLKAEKGSTIVKPRTLTRHGIGIDLMTGSGHLAPMEAPDRVADWIAGQLNRTT